MSSEVGYSKNKIKTYLTNTDFHFPNHVHRSVGQITEIEEDLFFFYSPYTYFGVYKRLHLLLSYKL